MRTTRRDKEGTTVKRSTCGYGARCTRALLFLSFVFLGGVLGRWAVFFLGVMRFWENVMWVEMGAVRTHMSNQVIHAT